MAVILGLCVIGAALAAFGYGAAVFFRGLVEMSDTADGGDEPLIVRDPSLGKDQYRDEMKARLAKLQGRAR